jgi:hypothetical protein
MADGHKDREDWQLLPTREEETFADPVEVREEDAKTFPLEFIQDRQEDYSPEERENLGRKIGEMSAPEKFRLAVLGNRVARNLLIHDPNKIVSQAVLKNQKLNETEVAHYAQRKNLSQEVILGIAKDQKWRKSYSVRLALVCNPKTPVSVTLNLLPHLLEKDLKALSHIRDLSSAVTKAAETLVKRKRT